MAMTRSFQTVVFSHGKESGPWGAKIVAMAEVAREFGVLVESVDYQGIDDPLARVEKLLTVGASFAAPLVLVGSSMGGHVSAAVAASLRARARSPKRARLRRRPPGWSVGRRRSPFSLTRWSKRSRP